MMGPDFESPVLLALCVVLPLIVFVLRYTLVDSPKAQRAVSAAVRVVVLAFIVLALAGTLWITRSTDVAVLVLADMSDSVPEGASEQVSGFLEEVVEEVGEGSEAGLLVFGATAEMAVALQETPEFPEVSRGEIDGSHTSIERALVLAREVMPMGKVKRIVLFSDGNQTEGDAVAHAKRCAAHGIRIDTIAYDAEERDEVLLEDLRLPSEVRRGQSFPITAVVHSNGGPASFILYRNGFKIDERSVDLEDGVTTLRFEETNPADGLTKYELHVRSDNDFYADNNVSSGIVFVSGEPRVLLLEGEERDARYLSRALEAENIRVEVRESKGMPGSLAELASFDAILFSDVAATDVSVQQMSLLRTYIEDLGGGFVMIGGEESFGLGGYYRTTIEDALPVRMRAEKRKDTPSLAMMLVIDKSGSMNGEKMELAKEAAIATVEVLGTRDYVGVVVFDGQAYWCVDLQNAGNRAGVIASIETVQAGGGTNIYPALVEAQSALSRTHAAFKHAVLLTDGHSQPGDFADIVDQMANEAITVSTVAVGEGADVNLLQDIARWGRGRYYFTADPHDIPQIFTKETMTASKSSLVEEPFLPQVFHQEQTIGGIDWDQAPFLFGYVVTTPKATADVSLVTERGDPLLASWRFGLGKTVAFMSDAKSRWAADWLGWPGYGTFWAQVVRDVMRTTQHGGNETTVTAHGDSGQLVVDSIDEHGNFLNGLDTVAQLIDPHLAMESLALQQTAPGRYEASFPMKDTGSYLFKIRQTLPETDASVEVEVHADYTRGMTISYKPEYRRLTTDDSFLRELAVLTGGQLDPEISEILAVTKDDAVPLRKRLWPWLLLAALLLFVIDVALRRLDLAGHGLLGQPSRYG